jgi:hypothetical protein
MIPSIIHGIKNSTHNQFFFFILDELLSSTPLSPVFHPSKGMEVVPLALSCSWDEGELEMGLMLGEERE